MNHFPIWKKYLTHTSISRLAAHKHHNLSKFGTPAYEEFFFCVIRVIYSIILVVVVRIKVNEPDY